MTINWLSGQAQCVPAVPHQTAKWPHQQIRKETINQPQWHHTNRTVVTTGKGKINNQPAFCVCAVVATVGHETAQW